MAVSGHPIAVGDMGARQITVKDRDPLIGRDDLILITGATGFIGSRLVRTLIDLGFRNLRCFARSRSAELFFQSEAFSNDSTDGVLGQAARVEVFRGNLLSREDCDAGTRGVSVVFHLAAGRGEKSISEAFRNSVVTTRNLLEGARQGCLKRFVNVGSFSVYSNRHKFGHRLLDETCQVETHPELRGDAYSFAKTKQDELVAEYATRFAIPYVIVRPGYVIGPGNPGICGRVGIGTFGMFLHLGGSNRIPFTYVDNCADAIVLAGLTKGVDGEVFNIVDDDLPSSREFLRLYKREVRRFKSIFIPHFLSFALCYLWEKYSACSQGQLPPAFNRRVWHAYWKKTKYSNAKLKSRLGWQPRISMAEGLRRHFEACRDGTRYA
jgi:nucleoside-diphosphate-sugar epimerase